MYKQEMPKTCKKSRPLTFNTLIMEPLVAEPSSSVIFRPLFENISVHRIQLRFTTATRPGSENDQGVYVQLKSADQRFWLYRAMDNYEAGHVDTYDVLSPN